MVGILEKVGDTLSFPKLSRSFSVTDLLQRSRPKLLGYKMSAARHRLPFSTASTAFKTSLLVLFPLVFVSTCRMFLLFKDDCIPMHSVSSSSNFRAFQLSSLLSNDSTFVWDFFPDFCNIIAGKDCISFPAKCCSGHLGLPIFDIILHQVSENLANLYCKQLL